MQLVSAGLYNAAGMRRDVTFALGALNVLTGKSKTGKSAILDIIEYCLGRDTVTIPTGVISDHADWYYVLVQIGNSRVFIARPNPETASTNRAMIKTGGMELSVPSHVELEVNSDTTVVREVLSARLGIDRFIIEGDSRSLRSSFEVTVRQALFFCFQKQGEIGNQAFLFHRQAEDGVKSTIRDALPYFLGASTPEQSAIERELTQARRVLMRHQRDVRIIEADLAQQGSRLESLVRSATSLGILPEVVQELDGAVIRRSLEAIVSFALPADDVPGEDDAVLAQRRALLEQNRVLRSRLRDAEDQLAAIGSFDNEQNALSTEVGIQRDRLRAMDYILPRSTREADEGICPLCDQSLVVRDDSIAELRGILAELDGRASTTDAAAPRRQAAIETLERRRTEIGSELRANRIALDAVGRQDEAIAAGKALRERIAFLQGRVSQELERGVDVQGDLDSVRTAERRARGVVARLEQQYEENDPEEALRSAIESVSQLMTDFARVLRLEGAEYFVRLDPKDLTVVVQRPGGRVPLTRMGSAENWIGYHLATHLALHHWFVTQERPVPRFMMFDQPTQAFFPEEVVDATEDENADWEAVRRQFTLMRDVVDSLDGALQIIVCDHANLADDWFQAAVVDNWRNGVALIPSDWLGG